MLLINLDSTRSVSIQLAWSHTISIQPKIPINPDMSHDEKYMARALQLAAYGAGHVSPNPMVGAVIVSASGQIIGEGFHRRYGQAHAEVNAVNSVADSDRHLLPESTIYVTLEPCSHWGKTPPCAALLCGVLGNDECHHASEQDSDNVPISHPSPLVRRVVVGTGDPNPRVAGRGIAMLREAGIEVTENVLQKECLAINVRFFTAQTKRRPWILLKWAETAEGAMAAPDGTPLAISNPTTLALMHAQRAMCDAILAGTNTLLSDNPSFTTRLWPGNSPRPVVFASKRLDARHDLRIFSRNPIILDPALPLEQNMHLLFEMHGITSLMVEGGRQLLDSFLAANLQDCIRIERPN